MCHFLDVRIHRTLLLTPKKKQQFLSKFVYFGYFTFPFRFPHKVIAFLACLTRSCSLSLSKATKGRIAKSSHLPTALSSSLYHPTVAST
jgi:hypothetical protein